MQQPPSLATGRQYPCPNPLCDKVFSTGDLACLHLAVPDSFCSRWAMDIIDRIHNGSENGESFSIVIVQILNDYVILDENLTNSSLSDAEEEPSNIEEDHQSNPSPPHPTSRPTTGQDLPNAVPAGLRKEYHPNASRSLTGGRNLLQIVDETDDYREARKDNVHYPFASRSEWQLANWLSSASLSKSDITSFLRLDYVCGISSFHAVNSA